jgi:hypothetical protein
MEGRWEIKYHPWTKTDEDWPTALEAEEDVMVSTALEAEEDVRVSTALEAEDPTPAHAALRLGF